MYVVTFSDCAHFAVMQSRIHTSWAWLLSSTMKQDLNSSGLDAFATFPFPSADPRVLGASLEDIGQRLYDARAAYMIDTQQGLTQTYNHLKNPDCHDQPIEALRRMHEEMDRAVLAAYGWSDIPVPPFVTPEAAAEKKALEAFEDEVIDRLFLLNAKRAEEERILGSAASAPSKKVTRKAPGKKKPAPPTLPGCG